MVLTSLLAMQRAGISFASFVCLVVVCRSACGADALSSIHQADRGGSVPYCLGAAPLEAGGNRSMGCNDPYHRRRQPVAPVSYANLIGLINRKAASRVVLLPNE